VWTPSTVWSWVTLSTSPPFKQLSPLSRRERERERRKPKFFLGSPFSREAEKTIGVCRNDPQAFSEKTLGQELLKDLTFVLSECPFTKLDFSSMNVEEILVEKEEVSSFLASSDREDVSKELSPPPPSVPAAPIILPWKFPWEEEKKSRPKNMVPALLAYYKESFQKLRNSTNMDFLIQRWENRHLKFNCYKRFARV